MSRPVEELLQDYLDGRLRRRELEEFEALLKRDADLAGRVEACREYGRALKEDLPELPPGFCTRARARFEESRTARRTRLIRLLFWEAAGLAAAAALAGVLFIPGLLQGDRQGAPLAGEAEKYKVEPEKKLQEASPERPALPGEARSTSPALAAEAQPESPVRKNEKKGPPAPQRNESDVIKPIAPSEEKGTRAARNRQREKNPEAMGVADAYAPQPPERRRLPRGAVAPGDTIVLETEEQWRNFIAGPARGTELASMSYDPRSRWILIGARPEAFDCAGIEVESRPDRHRIILRLAEDPAHAAEWGCAISLPRDGRTIEIVSNWNNDHE